MAPAVILLHGFPESHRTWRSDRAVAGGPLPAGDAGPAGLRRLGPASGGRSLRYRSASRGPVRARRRAGRSTTSRWSATTGAERSPGRQHARQARADQAAGHRQFARTRSVFQKSLIEDETSAPPRNISMLSARRASSNCRATGFDWFFEKTFSGHVDLALIPKRAARRTSPNGRSRAHSQRCSTGTAPRRLVVPPPGVTAPLPDFLLRFSKHPGPDTSCVGDEGSRAVAGSTRRAAGVVDDLQIVADPRAPAISSRGRLPVASRSALAPFLAGRTAAATAPRQ